MSELRDKIAIAAMQGIIANPDARRLLTRIGVIEKEQQELEKLSQYAYKIADAMLKER